MTTLKREIYKQIAKELQDKRTALGLEYSDIVRQCRLSAKAIKRTEKGATQISWRAIGKLLEFYDLELNFSLTDKND